MITRIDITEALAALTGSAPDKTPKPSEIVIQAWAKYFAEHPSWTGDDLASAVYEYAKTPRERMVQPADLGDLIRGWQRDAYERMDPNERETAWGDLGGVGQPRQLTFGGGYVDAQGQRRDRFGFLDKSEPGIEYPQEWTSQQRLNVYWERVRTGFSNAPSVGPCPDEHPPGPECADPECDRPSTFGPFCARHYVQSKCAPFGIEIPL